jgi:spermidine synthase
LLYGLTGFSGLVAEQGFEKYTSLLVGATASASAVVLFTYFLGFATGSAAAGHWIRRGRIRRPLLVYGLVELLIGISCVLFAYSFHGVMERIAPFQNLFGSGLAKFGVRFLCGCLLVLPTASLMGASFPLIASALDSGQSAGGKRWLSAYSANLAGALLATLTTPVAILPMLGLRGAMWVCGGIGLAVCVAALVWRPRSAAIAPVVERERGRVNREHRLLLLASFASGVVFFSLEVIWTHLIGVVIGSSIYAFSWMLACVLLGLLLGSTMMARGVRNGRMVSNSRLFLGCTATLAIQFLLWGRATTFFTVVLPATLQNSFVFAECYKFYVTCILIVPPATLLGLIYPRLLASGQTACGENSYFAGYLNAANSLGCLTGALAGIFVLVPLLGSEASLKSILLVLVGLWLLFLRRESGSPARWVRAAAPGAVMLVAIGAWHWDWRLLTAGLGNYFGQRPVAATGRSSGVKYLPGLLVFRHESIQGGLTTVAAQPTIPATYPMVRTLFTNGKFQGDDNPVGEVNSQFGFAGIPSQFVKGYDDALVIGLGTGHTAAALRRLGYQRIDIAEFSSGIAAAAREKFADLNEGILSDDRVRLYLEDGRNLLLTDRSRAYDLISIEISSLWFAGETNVYSKEFYELAQKRLKPGGVLQQWVQFHHIGAREIASIIATARTVFPSVSLWYYGHQGMLLASNRQMERNAGIAARLTASGMPQERAARVEAEMARAEVAGPDGVSRMCVELRPQINTDHNRWLEYTTPRYNASSENTVPGNLAFFAQYRE